MNLLAVLSRWAAPVVLAVCLLLFTGCGDPVFAEVEGTLTLDGQPLPNVEVAFLGDPEKGNRGPHARSYTDEQGHYQLRCEAAPKQGVFVGVYRVCVHDIAALPPLDLPDPTNPERRPGQPPRLPSRLKKTKPARVPPDYTNPAKTPLRDITVKPGKQTLNFDIKTAAKPG